MLDYDAKGNLVGIDIDNASRKVDLDTLILSKPPGGYSSGITLLPPLAPEPCCLRCRVIDLNYGYALRRSPLNARHA